MLTCYRALFIYILEGGTKLSGGSHCRGVVGAVHYIQSTLFSLIALGIPIEQLIENLVLIARLTGDTVTDQSSIVLQSLLSVETLAAKRAEQQKGKGDKRLLGLLSLS
jgi:hypothetical protein